ncbi:MAG: RnfABCDGE type electron transport complex subunit G [Pseudomonadota bacterium]
MKNESVSVIAGTLRLVAIATLAAGIVAGAWHVTRQPIADNLHAQRMAEFAAVLGDTQFDTLDYNTPRIIESPHGLPGTAPAVIYTAYQGGELAAWVFVVHASGYNAPIQLMIGLRPDSEVIAVRVLNHSETPGLADDIERTKSDWISSFDGQRVANASDPRWALRQDGGEFDSFTGASITPRAVVQAVRDTAAWAQQNAVERLGLVHDE